MIGTMVTHYRITEQIGKGGMGVVYKAHDIKLERQVALKFLNADLVPAGGRQRFFQEARLAASIQHPNVCPIFEIDEHEGQPFFAMALVDGKTISRLVSTGPLPFSKALDIAIQAANGLAAAHQLGIVHRDIKSGNIIVGADGHATILDFGLAVTQHTERLTIPGATSGTVTYMSPEQAQGLTVDQRSDIWSLGVVLFEMLTGKLPFYEDSIFGTMNAILNKNATAVTALRPQLPKEIEVVLNRALAKDLNQRFQSADQMADELRRLRDSQSQPTRTVPSFQALVSQASSKRRVSWQLIAVVLAGLVVIALAIYFAVRKSLPEEKQIAVLPFQIIGNQNDQAVRAIADGLMETLTAKLSQVQDFQGKLVVIPASEIRNRKITSADEARKIYGANLVITGSAELLGNRLQFNEVLVDSEKLRQLGAVSFDVLLDKSTDIRNRAVDGVMGMLHVKLQPITVTALDEGETEAPAAYSEYLKGVGYLARYDVSGNIDRALGSLANAVSADSKYALAFAALGEAHWRKAKATSDPQEKELALSNIQHALQIDNRLTAAHIKLGEIYSESGKADLAIKEEKDALQLAPNNAQAYRALGVAYEATGRFGEAEEAYKKSIACQPTDWYSNSLLGYFYVQRGRLSEARTAYETALALTPDNEIVFRNIAALDMREGKFQAAIDLSAKGAKSDPRSYAITGLAYYYQHQYQDAATALETSLKLAPDVYSVWGNIGTVYRHIPGDDDKAKHAFGRAIELANKLLQVQSGDFRAYANLAEYHAKLGESKEALAQIDRIPEAARAPFIDRIVLVYVFSGDLTRAREIARSIPPNSPVLIAMKHDPDLEELWKTL